MRRRPSAGTARRVPRARRVDRMHLYFRAPAFPFSSCPLLFLVLPARSFLVSAPKGAHFEFPILFISSIIYTFSFRSAKCSSISRCKHLCARSTSYSLIRGDIPREFCVLLLKLQESCIHLWLTKSRCFSCYGWRTPFPILHRADISTNYFRLET